MTSPPPFVSHTYLMRMPEHTAALRNPWPRLTGVIDGLTLDMEDEFRFGHTVVKVGPNYRMGGSIKGGSSSIWVTVQEAALDAYNKWRELEMPSQGEDAAAYSELKHTLGAAGIQLASDPSEYEPSHGEVYRTIRDIVKAIPEDHFRNIALDKIQVGGWGPDAAKASAYKNGTVYIYDFAVYGAVRTLAGLFLHELGHAFHASLRPERTSVLQQSHETISRRRAFMGIEYLLDAESRIVYQEFIVEEFVAETYLLYTACGSALREFILSQPDDIRDAWWRAYSIYLDGFDGVGYI